MKLSKSKTKLSVALLVVFAMLLQLVSPIMPLSFADGSEDFRMEVNFEEGKAVVDWKFEYDPTSYYNDYRFPAPFKGIDSFEKELISSGGVEIGTFELKDSEVIVTIDKDLINEQLSYDLSSDIQSSPQIETLEILDEETNIDGTEDELEEPNADESEVPDTDELEAEDDEEVAPDNDESEEQNNEEETEDKDESEELNAEEEEEPATEGEEIGKSIRKAILFTANVGLTGISALNDEFDDEPIIFSGSFDISGAIALEADESAGRDLGNIFEFDFLKVNGAEIGDSQVIEVSDGTLVTLGYKWSTDGFYAKSGDWAEIQVPDAFKSDRNWEEMDIKVGNRVVGKYSLIDNVIRFVFNEEIEDIDVKNGFVNFGLEFNLEKFKEDIEQEIYFNDSKDSKLNVIARPGGNIQGIEKEGHPDKKNDAKEIEWKIDIINNSDEAVTNAKVKDIIPEGLVSPRDFVIEELIIGLDGNKTVGDKVTIEPNIAGNEFELLFESIAPYKGYRIRYTTDIEDFSKNTFKNDATFELGDKKLPAQATVGGLTRSSAIEKTGAYDKANDEIEWSIFVNKNGTKIDNAVIHDTLPDGLNIKPGSIVVKKNGAVDESIKPTSFPITLGEVLESDMYEIIFRTTIDWKEVNDGDYKKSNGFVNEAELYNGEDPLDETNATVSIVRDPILSKKGASRNYDDTLTWEIELNKAGHPIGDVILTDFIPAGLDLDMSSIKIVDEEGEDYIPTGINSTKITEGVNAGKTELKINLGNVGTKTLKITYNTKITDFSIGSFRNTVGIEGDGIGDEGNSGNTTVTPEVNVYDKKNASSSNVDYNKQTIGWKITVNPRKEGIASLAIEDTFPNKGMILMEDTVVVKRGTTQLVLGEDYTLEPRTEDGVTGYQKGFVITLLSKALPLTGEELTVEYKTSYDPEYKDSLGNTLDEHVGGQGRDRIYVNEARFTGKTVNGNDIEVTKRDSKTIRLEAWNSGMKTGRLVHIDSTGKRVANWVSGSDRKIEWRVYINYQKQNLGTGVTVTDTLQYDGRIDKDSIVVYEYTVPTGGGANIDRNKVLAPGNYSVALSEDGKQFILTFAEDFEVKERYAIEFLTSVDGLSQDKYTNDATANANKKDYDYRATLSYSDYNKNLNKSSDVRGRVFTGDKVEWEVKVNESKSEVKNAKIIDTMSAGLEYVEGSLEIFKLVGAEPVLIDASEYDLNVSKTDDEETVLTIEFKEDVTHILILKYSTIVTATSGEVNNKVQLLGLEIVISSIESEKLEARQFSNIGGEWEANKGALLVVKRDADTKEIIENNEATFELFYDQDGTRQNLGEHTTKNGILEIGNLELGTYYLKEVESPEGYVLSEEELEIVIDRPYGQDQYFVREDFENTKEKIEIIGTKKWVGGGSVRPDFIELQLYRQLEDGEREAVGEAVRLDGSENTPWTHTWTELDRTDIDGNEYKYEVDEVNVPDNYNKSISEDGLTVTNTYAIPEEGTVEATKVWRGGPSRRPTIWFALYRSIEGGAPERVPGSEIKKLENGTTEVSWTDLEETDEDGNSYIFSVKEVDEEGNDFTPNRYRKSESGLTVTNRYRTPGGGEDPEDPDDPEEPEDPDEPNTPDEPEDPDTPDEPEDPDTEIDIENPEGGVNPDDSTEPEEEDDILEITEENPQGRRTLPRTGEINPIVFYIAGAMMIGLGVVLRRRLVRDR